MLIEWTLLDTLLLRTCRISPSLLPEVNTTHLPEYSLEPPKIDSSTTALMIEPAPVIVDVTAPTLAPMAVRICSYVRERVIGIISP